MDDSVDHKLREVWRELVLIKNQSEDQTKLLKEIAQSLNSINNGLFTQNIYGKNNMRDYISKLEIMLINISGKISGLSQGQFYTFIGIIGIAALMAFWMNEVGVFK